MVDDATTDARGILAPDVGLTRFRLDRFAPSATVARLVDRYWMVVWDLPDGETFEQRVLPHPVTNAVFEGGAATAGGVTTTLFTRRLQGRGRALGVMFRPAGFRPLLGRPMHTVTDVTMPFADVVGDEVDGIAAEIAATADSGVAVDMVDAFLERLVPARPHPAETTMRLAETAATDPDLLRVHQLAEIAGCSVRTLQRRFADHVGIGPKALIRRYRLYEAAEAARDDVVDWGAVAADLGYADQAHMIRDFHTAFGAPPAAYAAAGRPDG